METVQAIPEVEAWLAAASEPASEARFDPALAAASGPLVEGERLLLRLPPPGSRSPAEGAAAATVRSRLAALRDSLFDRFAEELYDRATASRSRPLRLGELVAATGRLAPGLLPDERLLGQDRQASLAAKDGHERDEASFLAAVLAVPACGLHLADAMRRPLPDAPELLERFHREHELDLGLAHLRRQGSIAILEIRNPEVLNAEDERTLPLTEVAGDVAMLDPDVSACVLRGGVVDHPRHRGRRVFDAGVNLKALASGRLPFAFFAERDLGWLAKLYHGLSGPDADARPEKPWLAVVDAFAIGGGMQLLLVVDHVLAASDSFFSLPATNEGFIPGAAPLRLPRAVGPRMARELMLLGRAVRADEPDARLLADTVVPPEELDAAVDRVATTLAGGGLTSFSANRRSLREGEEPLDAFVRYCAVYVREQARCMFSPELGRRIEAHWLPGAEVSA